MRCNPLSEKKGEFRVERFEPSAAAFSLFELGLELSRKTVRFQRTMPRSDERRKSIK